MPHVAHVGRGAAWVLNVAADKALCCQHDLLVAPYKLPSWERDDCDQLLKVLPEHGGNLCITFGDADPWTPEGEMIQ